MKILTLICLLVVLSSKSYAQVPKVVNDSIEGFHNICVEPISDAPPLFVLRMKDSEYIVDTILLKRIEASWVRKIRIGKQEEYNEKGKNGVIVIIPKRRNEDQITEALDLK